MCPCECLPDSIAAASHTYPSVLSQTELDGCKRVHVRGMRFAFVCRGTVIFLLSSTFSLLNESARFAVRLMGPPHTDLLRSDAPIYKTSCRLAVAFILRTHIHITLVCHGSYHPLCTLQQHPRLFPATDFNYNAFLWAVSCVYSRVFEVPPRGMCFAPLIDLCNHADVDVRVR